MRYRATMTSKGQLTLPSKLREALNLKAGDDVVFIEKDDGEIVLDAKRSSLADLRGIVRVPGAKIDQWIEEARAARGQNALPQDAQERGGSTR